MSETFEKELQSLINRHSKENDSDTPDYLLAEYLVKCMDNYALIIKKRDAWFGHKPWSEDERSEVPKVQ